METCPGLLPSLAAVSLHKHPSSPVWLVKILPVQIRSSSRSSWKLFWAFVLTCLENQRHGILLQQSGSIKVRGVVFPGKVRSACAASMTKTVNGNLYFPSHQIETIKQAEDRNSLLDQYLTCDIITGQLTYCMPSVTLQNHADRAFASLLDTLNCALIQETALTLTFETC